MQIKSLYVASSQTDIDVSLIKEALAQKFNNVSLFYPIVKDGENVDGEIGCKLSYAKEQIAKGKKIELLEDLIKSFTLVQEKSDFVLCYGVNPNTLEATLDFNLNLEIAKNLGVAYMNVLENSNDVETIAKIEKNSIEQSGCAYFATFISDFSGSSIDGIEVFTKNFDTSRFNSLLEKSYNLPITPSKFQFELFQRAKKEVKTIVLPESQDDRILKAAEILLDKDVVNIVLLGDENEVKSRAGSLNINLDKAKIVNPTSSEWNDEFANTFYELRKSKGISLEDAKTTTQNQTYFATMMIYLGYADGMVSGAVNTTADTIRPALQIIKTNPGISVVSSVFFMCLDTKVLVYGDCAVNPNPTPEELAQIATSSAQTSEIFGIEPKVAMLSYSTGTSGKGEDVDAVAKATNLVKENAPNLAVDGPIQYDAAVDMGIGSKKMPGSKVAGQASVFIFPDLNTGNNTYKAVQRSANALAIGPVLQGLKKPINDLSRGCLVEDIVNTVAITAIQAQGSK